MGSVVPGGCVRTRVQCSESHCVWAARLEGSGYVLGFGSPTGFGERWPCLGDPVNRCCLPRLRSPETDPRRRRRGMCRWVDALGFDGHVEQAPCSCGERVRLLPREALIRRGSCIVFGESARSVRGVVRWSHGTACRETRGGEEGAICLGASRVRTRLLVSYPGSPAHDMIPIAGSLMYRMKYALRFLFFKVWSSTDQTVAVSTGFHPRTTPLSRTLVRTKPS